MWPEAKKAAHLLLGIYPALAEHAWAEVTKRSLDSHLAVRTVENWRRTDLNVSLGRHRLVTPTPNPFGSGEPVANDNVGYRNVLPHYHEPSEPVIDKATRALLKSGGPWRFLKRRKKPRSGR